MANISSIKQRILQFIEIQNIAKVDFFAKADVSYTNFKGKALMSELSGDKIAKIIAAYPSISPVWLLMGEGDMLIGDTYKNKEHIEKKMIQVDHPEKGIPLIPINAMAGYGSGDVCVMYHECDRYVVPMLREAEFLISVKGDSMQPTYRSGDVVGCKRIPLSDIFYQPNKVYILDTDQGALLKRVRPQKGERLLIISDNSDYDPFELRQDQIHSVALVVGLIRAE